LAGARAIVAADFSRRRRELAMALGADVVVDPAATTPWQSWREAAVWGDDPRAPKLPPWAPGPAVRPAVVFECVGVPGVLDQLMAAAPRGTRIVVVGVCMEADTIHPLLGISKELNLQFVLGYTPEEFAATLGHIAEGAIPTAPLISGHVGLDGVAQAFVDLGSPERHAKILVHPGGLGPDSGTVDDVRVATGSAPAPDGSGKFESRDGSPARS
jgi:threonine dehydrogenase-like Zn-dependent dehydrogenase